MLSWHKEGNIGNKGEAEEDLNKLVKIKVHTPLLQIFLWSLLVYTTLKEAVALAEYRKYTTQGNK